MEWLLGRGKQEGFLRAQAHRSLAAPINNVSDLHADPHYASRGFWNRIESDSGVVAFPGSPLTMDGARVSVRRGAPRLGQHNREVLGGELGFSSEELAKLRESGVT